MLNYEEKIKFYLKYIIHLEIYGEFEIYLNYTYVIMEWNVLMFRIRYSMQKCVERTRLKDV